MRLVDNGIASRWIRYPPSNLLVPDSKSNCYLLKTSKLAWGKLHESTTQRFTLMVVPIAYGCNHSRLANLLAFWLASIETTRKFLLQAILGPLGNQQIDMAKTSISNHVFLGFPCLFHINMCDMYPIFIHPLNNIPVISQSIPIQLWYSLVEAPYFNLDDG